MPRPPMQRAVLRSHHPRGATEVRQKVNCKPRKIDFQANVGWLESEFVHSINKRTSQTALGVLLSQQGCFNSVFFFKTHFAKTSETFQSLTGKDGRSRLT